VQLDDQRRRAASIAGLGADLDHPAEAAGRGVNARVVDRTDAGPLTVQSTPVSGAVATSMRESRIEVTIRAFNTRLPSRLVDVIADLRAQPATNAIATGPSCVRFEQSTFQRADPQFQSRRVGSPRRRWDRA
jgi:hypothetical protein